MSVETFARLARWDRWANHAVFEVLRAAHGEPANALAAFQHVCEGQMIWLGRVAGVAEPNVPLWGEASLTQVEAWLPEIEARLDGVAASFAAGELDRTITYTNSLGEAYTSTVEECLLHMFLHSTQYRGEAAAFLNAARQRVPDLDFIFWVRAGEPV
jgi:uncharacterized damage-inducible protein DinB